MKINLTKTSLLLCAFVVLAISTGRAQQISEDEVPFTVQKWYFNNYPGSHEVTWMKTNSQSGELLYQADFEYDDQNVIAVFNSSGKQVYENLEFHKKELPGPILDHATSNYGKFKVVAIHKHTNYYYGAQNTKTTNYELIVKVDKDMNTVWFNEDMNRQDQFDVSNLAIK